jgi:hypothetical protein
MREITLIYLLRFENLIGLIELYGGDRSIEVLIFRLKLIYLDES